MINQNELRVGNRIADIWNEDTAYKVVAIGQKICTYGMSEYKCKYDKLVPIKTDEEVLLRAGFTKYEVDFGSNEFYWCHKDLPFAIDHKTWNVQKTKAKVEFVHKLQNFFFAHTGLELDFFK